MYPTKYTNISKATFLKLDVSKCAIILFIPEDGYHDKPESYPEGYIPNLKKHAETAKAALYIPAEDVGSKWGKQFKRPKVHHLHQISQFLKKNADTPILAVCDAGVSRSGFVTFFLDIKNNNLKGVKYVLDYDGFDQHFVRGSLRGKSWGSFYHTNPALTNYLLNSNLLTDSERKVIEQIKEESLKESKEDESSNSDEIVDLF